MLRHDEKLVLRSLDGEQITHKFIGFDIETQGETNDFVSLACYLPDGTEVFITDKTEAQEFLISRSWRGFTFVATNLTFDFCGVFWNSPYWNTFRMLMKGGDLLLAKYPIRERTVKRNGKEHRANEYIRFLDTMNYVPFGVEKLGEIIGYEKKTPPEWLGQRSPQTREEWDIFREYNIRDAEVSQRFMVFLQESIHTLGGNLKTTSASTALDVFRRNYLTKDIYKEEAVVKDPEGITAFIREAYYGGRTETFKRGYVEGLNDYDVNSLYPAVMRNEYPLPQSCYRIKTPHIDNITSYHGVSRVLVTCPEHLKIPLLPYRDEKNQRLIFPTGSFRGVYNHVELRKALQLGYTFVVEEQIIYTDTFRPFKEYVETLYAERLRLKNENNPMELGVKLLLNSLYGKFGERDKQDVKIVDVRGFGIKEWESIGTLQRAGATIRPYDTHYMIVKDKPADMNFVIPILASYTTSYARLLLYEYLEKHDVYYCDTDSVFTKDTLPTDNTLGAMKLERRIDEGVLCRAKLYRIDDTVKAKGISRASLEDFEAILKGVSIEKFRFMKPRLSLVMGLQPNQVVTVAKTVDLEDEKRNWPAPFDPRTVQESTPLCLTNR